MKVPCLKSTENVLSSNKGGTQIKRCAIQLLDIYPKEMKSVPWRDICAVMFIALLFTIAQIWKQSKCPLTVGWIKKMWHMNLMEYYWTLKKEEIPAICNSMDEVWGPYAKRKNQTKMPYELSYMCILKKKNNPNS